MAQDKKTMKQRSSYRLHFKNKDMDYYLMCILANEAHGGASFGEVLGAASRIKESDPESWAAEWLALGKQCEERGAQALAGGHKVSARNAFLRAYTYYRWGDYGIPVAGTISPTRHPSIIASRRLSWPRRFTTHMQ